jgi:hypothetical protein
MLKLARPNQPKKEWTVMRITIDFENGMQLALKPENLQLIDNGGDSSALITRTENAILPLVFFKVPIATPDEVKARSEKATAAAKAAEEAAPSATQPDGNWREPAAPAEPIASPRRPHRNDC